MTGKELKQFAAAIPDESSIKVETRYSSYWQEEFTLKAVLEVTIESKHKDEGDEK